MKRTDQTRNASPLARDFWRWLKPFIDHRDYGFRTTDGVKRIPTYQLEAFYRREFFPQPLTARLMESHLRRTDLLYYVSRRASGHALLRLDIDFHKPHRQDALEAALWLRAYLLPQAYHEPSSGRGHSLYAVINVDMCRSATWNALLARLQTHLRWLLAENNFASTLDVQGEFNVTKDGEILHPARLARMPMLYNGESDLCRLITAPVFQLNTLLDAVNGNPSPSLTQASSINREPLSPSDSEDAWWRMREARYHFSTIYRRDPDLDELKAHYRDRYNADDGDKARVRRARDALKYSTFDLSAGADGGFEKQRSMLLGAIHQHVGRMAPGINDIDLSVALYTYTCSSFSVPEKPSRMWTCGYARVAAIFSALKPITNRGGCDRRKIKTMRDILERAGLIECQDRGYVAAGAADGICQKWTISKNHPRYAEFVKFQADLHFERVADSGKKTKSGAVLTGTVAGGACRYP